MIRKRVNDETILFWANAQKAENNVNKWPEWKKKAGEQMMNKLSKENKKYELFNVYVEGIDLELLRQQRNLLCKIERCHKLGAEEVEQISGLINLCNNMLDKIEGYE